MTKIGILALQGACGTWVVLKAPLGLKRFKSAHTDLDVAHSYQVVSSTFRHGEIPAWFRDLFVTIKTKIDAGLPVFNQWFDFCNKNWVVGDQTKTFGMDINVARNAYGRQLG